MSLHDHKGPIRLQYCMRYFAFGWICEYTERFARHSPYYECSSFSSHARMNQSRSAIASLRFPDTIIRGPLDWNPFLFCRRLIYLWRYHWKILHDLLYAINVLRSLHYCTVPVQYFKINHQSSVMMVREWKKLPECFPDAIIRVLLPWIAISSSLHMFSAK